METLKTAVIGTGNMGQHHVRVYTEIEGSELVGISDQNISRASEFAAKYSTTAFKDYKEMLKKTRPDCVSVAVPTALHAKIGMEVLQSSNTLIEKPIAVTETEGLKLISSSKNNEKMLMIGQIERYNPVVQYLKEHLKGKRLLSLATERLGLSIPEKVTTGVILDLGIHDIDVARYLSGEEPINVYPTAQCVKLDTFEDHASILMKMPTCSAQIIVNWISPIKIRKVHAILEKEFISFDYITQKGYRCEKMEGADPLREEAPKTKIELERVEPLANELSDFLDAVRHGKESPISGEDALKSLKIAIDAESKVN